MRRFREQKIDAYRDGALSPRRRAAVGRRLSGDREAQAYLRQSEAIGRAVREVWSEGPPAPRVDLLIQSLRPFMARLDEEIAERSSAARWLARVRDLLGPVPLALAGAAAMLALALATPGLLRGPDGADASGSPVSTAGIGSQPSVVGSPSAIYDLAQDTPLMIFQGEDGSTVIWILEAPDPQALAPLSLSEW